MNNQKATNSTLVEDFIAIEGVDPVSVYGLNDELIDRIEKSYPEVRITARGNKIKIKGTEKEFNDIKAVVEELIKMARRNQEISAKDIDTLIALRKSDEILEKKSYQPEEAIIHTHAGEPIRAKTPGQKKIVEHSSKNDVLFAIGPAGTGKTYTSVALAVRALKDRQVKKIVLVRPAVEAGESLGFLPGDLKEKIDPYLRPLYDALEEMIDFDRLQLNLSKNIIEIAPLAYMRGRTLNNAFVILDEAQNATQIQMKMFLTRLGMGSRAIITGDITQTDLPKKQTSGLAPIQHILKDVEGISFVYLDENDVVRHKLVRDIINAYEEHEKQQSNESEKS